MHRILMIATCILLFGCSVFKKPHDQPVKSSCDVCKEPPFYINGQRTHDRHQR